MMGYALQDSFFIKVRRKVPMNKELAIKIPQHVAFNSNLLLYQEAVLLKETLQTQKKANCVLKNKLLSSFPLLVSFCVSHHLLSLSRVRKKGNSLTLDKCPITGHMSVY